MLFQFFADVRIFHRNDTIHEFNNSHFGAHRIIKISKLNTNRTATHNNHRFWLLSKYHCIAVADDLFAILWKIRQLAASSASRDNNILTLYDLFSPISGSHFNLSLTGNFTISHYHINLVLLHQELNTLAHFVGYTSTSLHNCTKIMGNISSVDTIICTVFHVIIYLCTFQQGLGWNTTPIKTNATETFLFNNRHLETKLRSSDCSWITTRTATENKNVVCHNN